MEGNQMAAVTAGMVKELREMTGAGMMDCKKALAATDGDMEKAVEFLREKGLAAASKKAGRIAAEGIVKTLVSEDGKSAAIVEVNSETDFVAKNAQFQGYVADVASQVLASSAADMEAFMAEPWAKDTSLTVAQELSSQIAIIGENMNIRRFEKIATDGVVIDYIHGGGRIGGAGYDGVGRCARGAPSASGCRDGIDDWVGPGRPGDARSARSPCLGYLYGSLG